MGELSNKCTLREKEKRVREWLGNVEEVESYPKAGRGQLHSRRTKEIMAVGVQDDASSSEDAGTLSNVSTDADKAKEMGRPVWQLLNEQEADETVAILIGVKAPDSSAAMLMVPVDRDFQAFYEQIRTLPDIDLEEVLNILSKMRCWGMNFEGDLC